MVHSSPKNTKSRVHQTQACFLNTTHLGILKRSGKDRKGVATPPTTTWSDEGYLLVQVCAVAGCQFCPCFVPQTHSTMKVSLVQAPTWFSQFISKDNLPMFEVEVIKGSLPEAVPVEQIQIRITLSYIVIQRKTVLCWGEKGLLKDVKTGLGSSTSVNEDSKTKLYSKLYVQISQLDLDINLNKLQSQLCLK